jgi:ketosteroid isomerase-like protein
VEVAGDPELDIIRGLDLTTDEQVNELVAADCVYHEDPHWIDGRVLRGRGEIAAILAEYRDVWGTREQDVEGVERVGDAIVAGVRQRGVTPKGEIPFDQVWTYVFRMRDGQISEMWAFADREEALEKAKAI